ncbi:MAG: hypothetical protein U0V73_08945 [Acidimicrobiia bacterium]
MAEQLAGRVVAFDAHRGLGEIEAGDGTRFPFHCTQVADGSRTIAVGAAVRFRRAPGLGGRWEAASIRDA